MKNEDPEPRTPHEAGGQRHDSQPPLSILHPSFPFTVVLGLGNPLRGDDGVGQRVADAVERLLAAQPIPGVIVRTSTRAGLDVIDLIAGAARAIVVDCLTAADACPGRVRRLPLDVCPGSARLVGAHDLSLRDVIELARAAGHAMPDRVEVYGIEATETLAIGEGLSSAVARAADSLALEICRRLRRAPADDE